MPNALEVNTYTPPIMPSGCPVCHAESDRVDYGSINVDSDTASQEATCGACGAEWSENYTFSGISLHKGLPL
jgi:hypothetical protein